MSDELNRILERIRQRPDALNEQRAARLGVALGAPRSTAAPLSPGARVFDTVSGEFGEVVHATRENVIVPTAK
jgi:hypothetical protein